MAGSIAHLARKKSDISRQTVIMQIGVRDVPGGSIYVKDSRNVRFKTPRWKIAAGTVEHGETFFQTASREAEEETRVIVPPDEWRVLNEYSSHDASNPHTRLLVYGQVDSCRHLAGEDYPRQLWLGDENGRDIEVGIFTYGEIVAMGDDFLKQHLQILRDIGAIQ